MFKLQNSRFRKVGSAVSVILECEAREPHTPAIWSVARVRKKYGCFAVYKMFNGDENRPNDHEEHNAI